jgi:hypothetical protein
MPGRLRLIAFCAGLLASAGCSNERRLPNEPTPLGPTAPTAPSSPSAPQRLAALALLDAASVHAEATTSPLAYATEDGKVWTNGPCVFGDGSLQGSLDGGLSPTSGTFLPTGSHTYVVSFSNCLATWWGTELNGVASVAYNAAEWSNLTAVVSANSVRGKGLAFLSELYDVTADGSGVWTSVGSSTRTTTYTPASGSRLVNNSTANVATFGGGLYSTLQSPNRLERRFDDLKVAINGTEYTLNGSLVVTHSGTPLSGAAYNGEIRIINNGTLVARVYGDARNALTIEVLVPLVPL